MENIIEMYRFEFCDEILGLLLKVLENSNIEIQLE